jgi:hypothetical protein
VLLLPLAGLASVRLLAVEVREDELEDIRIPAHCVALQAFLDVL